MSQLTNANGDDDRRDGWYLWCSLVTIVCCHFILFVLQTSVVVSLLLNCGYRFVGLKTFVSCD